MSDQTLNLQSQVLNANFGFSSFETRHKISIEFLRDAEIAKPMIPLFPIPAYGMKLVEGEAGYFGVPEEEVDPEVHGVGCLPGVALPGSARLDSQGRVFTGHWEVAPGLEENHTLVTEKMDLPFDTTIHYIAAHLHPYAESLELYDLTARKTVYKTRARNTPDRIGLEEVEYFASVEGLPVYKDHQYEIVSMYNNTTDEPQTAMAGFFLYLRAKDLEKAINESRASQRASGSELTAAPQE
jgi:hypothetical protein